MDKAKVTPSFPDSGFVPVNLPRKADDFGTKGLFQLSSAPVRNNVPDFSMVAWRMMEASARMVEFRELLPQVQADWTGYMEVRAPLGSPMKIEMRLREWQWNHMPSARRLTFIASEIVHHVRVSLDYIAYNAVWLAKGEPRSHTKFPIVTQSEKWNQERRKGIPGVKEHHREWVEEVQPFKGVEWTKNLLDLSNQDKHRTAVELIPLYSARFDPSKIFADPAGDPTYRGFQAEHPRVEMRIVPAMEPERGGPPGADVGQILGGLIEGGVGLVNKFITEAGYTPMELVRPDDEDADTQDETATGDAAS